MPEGIIDACCFINLYATGDLKEFLGAVQWLWSIPRVALAESLYIRVVDSDGNRHRELIRTEDYVRSGLLAVVDVNDESELELYVRLARDLGDGEAMALAIAKLRSWTLATDDRKAKRIAADLDVRVITTPELMEEWARVGGLPASRIGALLRSIESQARFKPARNAPGYEWWIELVGEP